jgi:hypothetical protein
MQDSAQLILIELIGTLHQINHQQVPTNGGEPHSTIVFGFVL